MSTQPVTRRELPPDFEYIGTSTTIRVRKTFVLGDYRETIRRSTKTSRLSDAKAMRDKWVSEARQRALGHAPALGAAATSTIAAYLPVYIASLPLTRQYEVKKRLEMFVADCGETMRLDQFIDTDAEAWKNRRLAMINTWGRAYNKSTVREDCNKVKAFFEFARKKKQIVTNPWQGVELPQGTPRNDEVTIEEQTALLAALKTDEDRRAVRVLLGTGLRNEEFFLTRLAHMTLHGTDPLIEVPAEIAKYGHPRTIPLQDETVMVLVAQQQARGLGAMSTDPLWSYGSLKGLRDRMASACRRAGIRVITPKMCRQTYGIRLANTTDVIVPRQFVTTALGHTSDRTTDKYYVRAQQRKFRETLRKIDLGLGESA